MSSPEWLLDSILHSWKSYSAQAANKVLRRRGPFWQKESYDHLIRDAADLDEHLEYIGRNPQKAGLADWPWCGAKIEYSGDWCRKPATDGVGSRA